jgi:hypothetical protein
MSLTKIVVLFLVGMAVLALFGRLKVPQLPTMRLRRKAANCPSCGRHKIGRGPCPCGGAPPGTNLEG